jgi:hypothetical protein
MTAEKIVYTMERDLAESVRCLAATKRRAAVNKLSLLLTLALIAVGVLVAAISKAGSPTTQPPVLFCGLLIECGIG